MAMSVHEQSHTATSILDLPYEVITHICSDYALTTTDIYNLAISHSKLNDYLFGEQNSSFWKTKYKQKYDDSEINVIKIAITEHSSWRNEIMLRMTLNKSVQREIMQMPSKYLRLKDIPYHVFPFGDELNSNNQNCRYYVYRSTLDFYKYILGKNHDVLYMAHQFLKYASKVFFSYKIQEFLSLPEAEQSNEWGFYLLGCWWCPTNIVPYNDIRCNLDFITFGVYNHLYHKLPLHSMFKNKFTIDLILGNGKSILDHDLHNKADSLVILEQINEYILHHNEFVCPCHQKFNCVLLGKVLGCNNGQVFLLCVLYQSIAKRLGVKVGLISIFNQTYLSWTPSYPEEININEATFSINIPSNHTVDRTIIRPDYKKCPATSVSDLMLTFNKFNNAVTGVSIEILRNQLYFEKLLKPEDTMVQFRFQEFHQGNEFCPCPLIRTPLNPIAPKHIDEKCSLLANWGDIFPLIPKRRGTNNDPIFSIGMMIKTVLNGAVERNSLVNYGIIVGWSKIPYSPCHDDIVYHILVKSDTIINRVAYVFTDIKPVLENGNAKLYRITTWSPLYFKDISKYFKHYDTTLCAFIPNDGLAKCYPDDFEHTVNSLQKLRI